MECGIISENAGTGQNGFVTGSNLFERLSSGGEGVEIHWGGGRNTLHCTAKQNGFYFYKADKIV